MNQPVSSRDESSLEITNGREADGKPSKGFRIVHVAVPDQVFQHAKVQALLAGKTWSEFITDTLRNSAANR
ncbi:hypothetical protein SAMN06265222_101638 [Neorhodopirellula lusitana]|uniref:Toxin-antitoxin system HicB family antitoxin n=1 Tax=Neorhodopirellula lusitana TaxID=445327 RepID=A0ABY1PQ54_9BACT|nr:hypothetical protein [Neorhodopirellula lusitana]SMP41712.1 hypothetical protein SAMN06265222_101638 [Neorhodopirellula lusitana]